MLYSILLAWAVLRILRYFSLADLPRLHRCVSILLAALSIYFVYAIFGAGLSDLLKGFQDLSASNQGSEWFGVDLTLTQGFLVLNFLLSVLPYVLNLFLVFSARQLLSALRRDRYSEESAAGAKRLSSLCRRTLSVSILGIAARKPPSVCLFRFSSGHPGHCELPAFFYCLRPLYSALFPLS